MLNDPIADMFTRIRNGYLIAKMEVIVPYSRVKEEIIKLFKTLGFIEEAKVHEISKSQKNIIITLKYIKGSPAITTVRRVSKSGRKIYCKAKDLPYVLSGLGYAIVSTSKGIMTEKDARKKGLGGEILAEIW